MVDYQTLLFLRPDLYGESITVVRTVTNSSSTYKLKDHRGKVVVEKKVKEELDRILMSFNIQVSLFLRLMAPCNLFPTGGQSNRRPEPGHGQDFPFQM